MEIDKILDEIKDRGIFRSIKRYSYDYDLESAKTVVRSIGEYRIPAFSIDSENGFIYENLIKWVMGDSSFQCLDPETKSQTTGRLDKGIFVAGNTGSGKSWALEIMSAFSQVDNIKFEIDGNFHKLSWGCYRADFICDEYAATGQISKYKQMPVLAVQDFGSEPQESLYMGNRFSVMRQIIETRGDHTDLITLISSNYPLNHKYLKDTYGDRVISRLYEMCNYFELKGKDRRK